MGSTHNPLVVEIEKGAADGREEGGEEGGEEAGARVGAGSIPEVVVVVAGVTPQQREGKLRAPSDADDEEAAKPSDRNRDVGKVRAPSDADEAAAE